ncbi:MAG TPA: phosphorylated adapter RNA export RNA-binding domain-containing protein, partial [Ktedonosporobacter sp.]|nr:phosphorylated adapter RNA export RNA-binding domain-containing protein [Ktedonosporobacter sp.]
MNEEHKEEQPTSPALQEKKEPTIPEVARMIADRLGETETGPRKQVERIVWTLGRTQALVLLERTVQIEEQGGMMLPDGSRRRTAGGVFFTLAYTEGVPKPGKKLFKPGLPS